MTTDQIKQLNVHLQTAVHRTIDMHAVAKQILKIEILPRLLLLLLEML